MRPFGIRYWRNYGYSSYTFEEYMEDRSPQACSWIRDQEYLVDFKYYDSLEFQDGGNTTYLHMFPKIRWKS